MRTDVRTNALWSCESDALDLDGLGFRFHMFWIEPLSNYMHMLCVYRSHMYPHTAFPQPEAFVHSHGEHPLQCRKPPTTWVLTQRLQSSAGLAHVGITLW
jgi:hypothetical protein